MILPCAVEAGLAQLDALYDILSDRIRDLGTTDEGPG
jgi:hypothetical protein